MHNLNLVFLVALLSSCTISNDSEAIIVNSEQITEVNSKRLPAKHVEPVILGAIKYERNLNEIIATSTVNEKVIWRKEIYPIEFNERLERDVQEIYIDSIRLIKNVLLIRNERQKYYLLNLSSQKVTPYSSQPKIIEQDRFSLSISEFPKNEFEKENEKSNFSLLNKKQCILEDKIEIVSDHEIEFKLSDGNIFRLKKETLDEQFHGYTFIHYNSELNIYVVWENWLEAGHPIMINGSTGEISTIFGSTFRINQNKTLVLNFGEDIGAGWTPNGFQILKFENNQFEKLFDFEPRQSLNEVWGPSDIKWQNDSTLLIKCIMNDGKGGFLTTYKKIGIH